MTVGQNRTPERCETSFSLPFRVDQEEVFSLSEREDRPVFVVGTGRCGLSLVVDMLASHPEMAWFSQYSKHYPAKRWAYRAPYTFSRPPIHQLAWLAEKLTGKNILPRPREAYTSFDIHFRGFGYHYRSLSPRDVHQSARDGLRGMIGAHIDLQRKSRFVCELSGRARILFLREIFPGAKFIHVVRDPRPTVNSWLNVDYWLGWRGESQWRWGQIPEQYRAHVFKDKPTFAAIAAVQYNMLVDDIIAESQGLDDSVFTEVRLEDMIHNTAAEVKRLAEFADLPYSAQYQREWEKVKVYDPNTRKARIPPWRDNLTAFQQSEITRICEKYLKRYRYIEAE